MNPSNYAPVPGLHDRRSPGLIHEAEAAGKLPIITGAEHALASRLPERIKPVAGAIALLLFVD